jgi:hypothetical protein
MEWEIEFTGEFGSWWESLSEEEQDSAAVKIGLLRTHGPSLGRPSVDTVRISRHINMKELRVQHAGDPYRILFCFDPRRAAILLLGGNKRGNDRWYEEFVPVADRIYDDYLDEIKKEGLIP